YVKRVPLQHKDRGHMYRRMRSIDDRGFRNYFRMKKESFFALLDEIALDQAFNEAAQVPMAYQLAVFLYRCSTPGASMHALANHFGLAEGTICSCIARVVLALLRLWDRYIYWPRGEEYRTNRQRISIASNEQFERC